jgi:HSP20 family protein
MLWPRVMRDLWGWDPWGEMRRLQGEMSSALNGLWSPLARRVFPAVNVWAGRDDAVVTAEVPGIRPAELDVQVVGDTLTVTGEREAERLPEGQDYLRQERPAGHFSRTIQLPYRVDPDKVEATYAKGVLRITLPRLEADKPKQINVKTN